MEYIIIFGLLAIFCLGFLLFDKLDKFLNSKEHIEILANVVLLYGKSDYTVKVISYLKSHYIPFQYIRYEYQVNNLNKFNCFFALSNDDMYNLSMAIYAKKVLKIKKVVALCSKIDNVTFFKERHIEYIQNINVIYDALNELFPEGYEEQKNAKTKNKIK